MRKIIVMYFLLLNSSIVFADVMTQQLMEKIVESKVEVIEKKKGYVVFMYQKVKMALISDIKHDRMRIVAAITKYPSLSIEQVEAVMVANFHRALDARYAVSNDILYSAFIHPMSVLSQSELEDALNQVSTLAINFGGSYSSGELSFGGQ